MMDLDREQLRKTYEVCRMGFGILSAALVLACFTSVMPLLRHFYPELCSPDPLDAGISLDRCADHLGQSARRHHAVGTVRPPRLAETGRIAARHVAGRRRALVPRTWRGPRDRRWEFRPRVAAGSRGPSPRLGRVRAAGRALLRLPGTSRAGVCPRIGQGHALHGRHGCGPLAADVLREDRLASRLAADPPPVPRSRGSPALPGLPAHLGDHALAGDGPRHRRGEAIQPGADRDAARGRERRSLRGMVQGTGRLLGPDEMDVDTTTPTGRATIPGGTWAGESGRSPRGWSPRGSSRRSCAEDTRCTPGRLPPARWPRR